MWQRALFVSLTLCLAGCALGKPLAFSDGTRWSFPVMSIGDRDDLVTPVYIGDKGPYLFIVVPGRSSAIDTARAEELDLFTSIRQQRLLDSSDTTSNAQVRMAQVPEMSVGDLRLRSLDLPMFPQRGTFKGYPVRGVIGSEVLDDTIAWTIDRDRQMVYLAVQDTFVAPATGKAPISVRNELILADVRINDRDMEMRVVFDSGNTVLYPWAIQEAQLEPVGTTRYRARSFVLGERDIGPLDVLEFEDKRVQPHTLDGVIGGEQLSAYRVTVNLHAGFIWLEERIDDLATTADRVTRWGTGCASADCVSASVTSETEGAMVELTRSGAGIDSAVDMVMAAYDESGNPAPLPRLLAVFPAGVTTIRVRAGFADRFLGTQLRVVDATPFPPKCPMPDQGCLLPLE